MRYAQSDQDIVAIHQFLLVVAGPTLPGPVDAQKSAIEVWRVTTNDVALMAICDDKLVGTLGLICPTHWWSDLKFLANRFFFCLPGSQAWKPLLKEARAIAVASDMELHVYSEQRGKITIFNKNINRQSPLANSPNSSLALAT